MTEQYYEILKIDESATLEEVKKAYRIQAKLLHPDVNKSQDAHENFILLNEAYEYLQSLKSGKLFDTKSNTFSKAYTNYQNAEDWQQTQREKARDRAQHYAQMEFEKYKKSGFYKTSEALFVIAELISVLHGAFIFSLPIILYFWKGLTGLFFGLFIVFITVHDWTEILIHDKPQLKFKEIIPAISHLLTRKLFQFIIAILLNLYFLLHIGLNTLIPLNTTLIAFCIAIILTQLIFIRQSNNNLKRFIVFAVAPGIINLFFILNFIFSSNPTVETYHFGNVVENTERGEENTTHIILENDKYTEYIGIRIFLDYDAMEISNTIEYTFADGLFGLRVMKSYNFK